MPSNEHRRRHAKKYYLKYKQVEEKIQTSLFPPKRYSSKTIKAHAKDSGIWASSFYRHYKNLDTARATIEKRYITDFRKVISKDRDAHTAFSTLILFVLKNRHFFVAAIKRGDYYVLLAMLGEIFPKISQTWPKMSKNTTEHIKELVKNQLLGELIYWGETTKFNSTYTDTCLNNLLRINACLPDALRSIIRD